MLLRAYRQKSVISPLFNVCKLYSTMDEFNAAKARLTNFKNEPDNATKLRMYSLFKQVTAGKCSTERPGMMDFVGRAKWDAWNALGDMSQSAAITEYISIVEELGKSEAPADSPAASASTATSSDSPGKVEGIELERVGKMAKLTLNRPKVKNAINHEMYVEITRQLNALAGDDSVDFLVITGTGEYFSSGNDLSNFTRYLATMTPEQIAQSSGDILIEFVDAIIKFPKLLVAGLNGPAVGIPVTMLGLFDIVYASDAATLTTPFSRLGQSPEACSSFTFPRIFGPSRAAKMLMLNHTMKAQEALSCGFFTEVFPAASFDKEFQTQLKYISELPPKALNESKRLIRNRQIELLMKVNRQETELLKRLWVAPECMNAVAKFLSKSK